MVASISIRRLDSGDSDVVVFDVDTGECVATLAALNSETFVTADTGHAFGVVDRAHPMAQAMLDAAHGAAPGADTQEGASADAATEASADTATPETAPAPASAADTPVPDVLEAGD